MANPTVNVPLMEGITDQGYRQLFGPVLNEVWAKHLNTILWVTLFMPGSLLLPAFCSGVAMWC